MSFRQRLIGAQRKRAAAVAAVYNQAVLPVDVLHPRDAEMTRLLNTAVHEIGDKDRPTNSQKSMDPKKEEWMQFCDVLYPGDTYRHIIDSDKCYRFMCYQSFREAKKRGGDREKLKNYIFFNYEQYTEVMSEFQNQGGVIKGYPTPKCPIGYSVFQSYKVALKEIFREQQARHGVSVTNSREHDYQTSKVLT